LLCNLSKCVLLKKPDGFSLKRKQSHVKTKRDQPVNWEKIPINLWKINCSSPKR
jgi:hypothetical protein